MDILNKLPLDITNKIFYYVAEHPVAQIFKKQTKIRHNFIKDDDIRIDVFNNNGRKIKIFFITTPPPHLLLPPLLFDII